MKHAKKSTFGLKHAVLIISAVLILAVGATATLAYLADSTKPVTNTFTPSSVTCYVEETFNGNAKSDVKIKNTGDIDAYIRVAVVANWVKDGNIVAPATVAITPANGWFKAGDYYYYPAVVAAGDSTENLYSDSITAGTAGTAPDGAKLKVDILAEAIQAEGYAISNWSAVSVSTDGTLAKGAVTDA